MNVIKQTVKKGGYNTQTIKMIMKASERGAQGEKGDTGAAATIAAGNAYSVDPGAAPAVMNTGTSSNAVFDFYIPKGEKGDDGAIHYTAGPGITIDENNQISATGEAVAAWGGIIGNLGDQTDLKNKLDTTVVTGTGDIGISSDVVDITTYTRNLFTGAEGTSSQAIPAATATTAGVLSSAQFNQINANTNDIATNATNIATKLSSANLTVDSTLNKTTTGSGTDTSIQLGVATSGVNTANIADSAVTTAKLADGAVTAEKINFSTIAGWGSMPVAYVKWEGPWGVTGHIYRIGNICMVSNSFVSTRAIAAQDDAVNEKLPQGFRPVRDAAIVIADATVSSNSCVYLYETDEDYAALACHAQLGHNGTWRGSMTGCWVTKDEWPSE